MLRQSDQEALIGASVEAIYISEDRLVFDTDRGPVGYRVHGDCCSESYFYDFYGVAALIAGGPVTACEAVDLAPGDPGYRPETWEKGVGVLTPCAEEIEVYGYRLTVEHRYFGDVSAVLSFRNSSNGYYGGWMSRTDDTGTDGLRRITEDVTEL